MEVKCLDGDIFFKGFGLFKETLMVYYDKKNNKVWFSLNDLIKFHKIKIPFCVIMEFLEKKIKKCCNPEEEYLIKDVKFIEKGKESIEPIRFISYFLAMSLEDFSNLPKDKKFNLDYHLSCIDWDTRAYEPFKVDIALEKEKINVFKEIISQNLAEIEYEKKYKEKREKDLEEFEKSIFSDEEKEKKWRKEEIFNLQSKINYREQENKEIEKMIKFRKKIISELKKEEKDLRTI